MKAHFPMKSQTTVNDRLYDPLDCGIHEALAARRRECVSVASPLNQRDGIDPSSQWAPVITEQRQTHAGDSVKCHNFTVFSDINTETSRVKGQPHKTSRGQSARIGGGGEEVAGAPWNKGAIYGRSTAFDSNFLPPYKKKKKKRAQNEL